jgi:uncharacterized hydrophobic protein (TIGR00341 family)
MAQRKVEVFINALHKSELTTFLEKNEVSDVWWAELESARFLAGSLTEAETAEDLFDRLEKKFAGDPGFRIIISPVEAVIPRIEEVREEEVAEEESKPEKKKLFLLRISRAELYDDITAFSSLDRNFIIMVVLSSVVAGIAILTENIPVLVGAMVIAPLLGPNLSLAFGTVLGDVDLVRKSAITALMATLIALVISYGWGMFYGTELMDIEIARISLSDIVLAFVSGAAGAVTILRGGSSSLVGVMVAVALLPPLMRTGLYAGGGLWMQSMHAFLIFLANTICVNLAGVLTFVVAGLSPKYWWEEKKAKKYSRRALALWTILLLVMVGVVVVLNVYN